MRDKTDFETGQIYRQTTTQPLTRRSEFTDISESERPPYQHFENRRQKGRNKRGPSYTRSNFRRPPTYNNRETWQSREAPRGRGNPPFAPEWSSMPLSSYTGATPYMGAQQPPNNVTPMGTAQTASMPHQHISGNAISMGAMQPSLLSHPPGTPGFLGLVGMELRDRERWGYQQPKPS